METAPENASKKVDKDLLAVLTSLPVWLVPTCVFFFAWVPLIIMIVRACSSDGDLKTGEIGDTIGGLTAPIIGLLNAVFVYHAFKQQLKANNLQFDAIRKEQKRFYRNSNFESLLLFKNIIADERLKTAYEAKGSSPFTTYGSSAIRWMCTDTYRPIEEPDFNKNLNTFQSLWLGMALEKYMVYLKSVYAWLLRLEKIRLSRHDKELLVFALESVAPQEERILSSDRYYSHIVTEESPDYATISELEREIQRIHAKYAINAR